MAVVGGGIVGACLARAIRGPRTALVAPRRVPQRGHDAPLDARVYALSPGNVAFLRETGVWPALAPERLARVLAMRVFGDDGRSQIEFDAYGAGVPELAWIAEDGALLEAAWRGLAGQEREGSLEVVAPAACERIEFAEGFARLHLDGGRELRARLVIGADGARSVVRAQAAIGAREHDYDQAAVVANFACARRHGGVARQWFRAGTVLALLPLPGDRVSMVWSVSRGEAARLLRLDGDALCRELEAATGRALGDLSPLTPAQSYPLRRLRAERKVAPRVALAGDAAHVVHPLAGQGANLGLQDARSLAAVLASREPGRDPGKFGLLRRYERARAEPTLLMTGVVHGLFRLFGARNPWLAILRNAGLNLTDRLPVLKNVLARQAMS